MWRHSIWSQSLSRCLVNLHTCFFQSGRRCFVIVKILRRSTVITKMSIVKSIGVRAKVERKKLKAYVSGLNLVWLWAMTDFHAYIFDALSTSWHHIPRQDRLSLLSILQADPVISVAVCESSFSNKMCYVTYIKGGLKQGCATFLN